MQLDSLINRLRFDQPGRLPPDLDSDAWFELADREHVTLAIAARGSDGMPDAVEQRLTSSLAANSVRFERIRDAYREIAARFAEERIEHVVLKGFSHWPCYTANPRHRPQYDLDLWCRDEDVEHARAALESLGYEPLFDEPGIPVDHLPPMIRKTGWQWRGDYFDAELPVAVEVHFRLWDEGTERIAIAGLDQFWERRTVRCVEDFCFPALDRVDTVGYAALHFLRHLLRGDFRLYHAYELAHFLDQTASSDDFWLRWQRIHGNSLRATEAIAFQLAARWFGCSLPGAVTEEIERLPKPVRRWFEHMALEPLLAKERPNKNELWLHLSLLHSSSDRAKVLKRRLLPKTHPARCDPHVPDSAVTARLRLKRRVFQVQFTATRLMKHVRALSPTVRGGLRLGLASRELNPQLLRFLGAASLFNFGLSVFFLLFNVLLVRRGFREDMVGAVISAASVGSIAGTLPGAYVLRRFGLSRTLATTFASVAAMCALRVLLPAPFVLIGSAFLGGLIFAFYAVAIPPTVAQLTTEQSRRTGFSIVFSSGIGIGIFAGIVGGRLPALLDRVPLFSGSSLEATLLAACAIAALGAIPASRLKLNEALETKPEGRRVYPSDPSVYRLLAALLVWNVATGAFNPFFNVYFTKELGMALSDVGLIFSASQAVQVVSLLMAPLVLRKLGLVSGLATMQCATAVALAGLASGASGALAGMIYAAYVASQYMSEPAIYSLLMERVAPEERSGASALNFLIVFGAQALAAAVAGIAVRRYGYRVILALAGLAALSAGLLMRGILEHRANSLSRTVPIS